MSEEDWHERGRFNAMMDANENAPCASIGGLDRRHDPAVIFDWVPDEHRAEFIAGYESWCAESWGPDWRTVTFGWAPVLELTRGPDGEPVARAVADEH